MDVHENVDTAGVRLDESEASIFLVIFHDTSRHFFHSDTRKSQFKLTLHCPVHACAASLG